MKKRPNFAHRPVRQQFISHRGFTLVEMLVALTLTLILMTAVVKVFGDVGPGIANARKALEQFDRLRTAAQQLNSDLNNTTARLDGRAGRPEEALGYAEVIEGSYGFLNPIAGQPFPHYAINGTTNKPDYSVGQRGDIIEFTARNAARPYVGRYNPTGSGTPQTTQSDVAEIAWFLRGNRLHRRVLLVMPGAAQALSAYKTSSGTTTYYNDNDISARLVNGKIVPNSLADLTKRENRFGHDTRKFPYDVRGWGTLGLPTLAECSSPTYMKLGPNNWAAGTTPAPPPAAQLPSGEVDMWDNSTNGTYSVAKILPDQRLNNPTNNPNPDGLRVSDDVVLTNVIGFDVKVWEPAANNGAGGYVDLGSDGTTNPPGAPVYITDGSAPAYQRPLGPTSYRFNNGGIVESGLSASGTSARTYDSGTFSYTNELGNSQVANGMDDNTNGMVDDVGEYVVTSGSLRGYAPGIPPYPVPLRGIQIKIRCFEPDSRQIREMTIEHDFLPK